MKTLHFSFSGRTVGGGEPCYLIAEVAQAHDGSLGAAHSYIDAVAAAGVDAIKFQTHIAAAESTPGEPFRINFSYQDVNRYEYWKRMEFTPEQWQGLADHCREVGIAFLSSPFSEEAVELLASIGMDAWKVGSGEVNNPLLLRAMAQTKWPILLSSGMSDWAELAGAIERIEALGVDFGLFQCTSKYPTQLNEVGLNVLDQMRERFGAVVGLSDHSGQVFPGLAAMARGVDMLEVHVVLSKGAFGPDTPASVSVDELRLLTKARDAFHVMNKNPVDKDAFAKEFESMRQLFNKSVSLRQPQTAGTILSREMLTVKKPGSGIPAESLDACTGRRLAVNVSENRVLNWEDLESS